MKTIYVDLRRRIVKAYLSGLSGTYVQTAKMFGVSVSSVSRLLRKKRHSGDILPLPRKANNPRKIDLKWLRQHAQKYPDARLKDRADAWKSYSGIDVHIATMSLAMHKIGWTYKKKRLKHKNVSVWMCVKNEKSLRKNKSH